MRQLFAIFLIVGSVLSSGPAFAQAATIKHEIAPATVDAAAVQEPNKFTHQPNKHFVYVPADPRARRGHLFLFIGGTNHFPSGTELIMQTGVAHGYHAISLAYSNYVTVGSLCATSTDAACSQKVREEIIAGNDVSTLVTVAKADSIIVRLTKLLGYLRANYPGEGWGQYLTGNEINWPMISVAGHSQGAGHAAYLAKLYTLRRAVMISGVADTYNGLPAPWLRWQNRTPVDRQFGFSHTADPVVPIAIAQNSWTAIGLDPQTRVVDASAPPYNGAHRLTTALPPRVTVPPPLGGINTHVSTVGDETTPRTADGSLAYAPVWSYMIFP